MTLDWNAPATGPNSVQTALNGAGMFNCSCVTVTKGGGVYRIAFADGSAFGDTAIPVLRTDPTGLQSGQGEKDVLNISDTGSSANDAAILTSTSLTGLDMPSPNSAQELTIDATQGQYTLTYSYAVEPTHLLATQASGGTLHAGTHYYVVTAVTASGESLPSNEVSAVTAENGAVMLSWHSIPGVTVTDYKIYRGSTQGGELIVIDTHSSSLMFTDDGTVTTPGSVPTALTANVFETETTAPIDWNASAADVQAALTNLGPITPGDVDPITVGDVIVSRNDDVYTINFQGLLSDTPIQPLMATPLTSGPNALQKAVEPLGGNGGTSALVNGTATISSNQPGTTDPADNQVQLLTIGASSGTYELQFHVSGVPYTTAPIAYNASAEQLREAIQNAIAAGESTDPNIQAYLVDKVDVMVERYPNGYLNQDVYVLAFQGELRKEQFGLGLDTVSVINSTLNVPATVTTRMNGIDYYGFEQVNIGPARLRGLQRPGHDAGLERVRRRRLPRHRVSAATAATRSRRRTSRSGTATTASTCRRTRTSTRARGTASTS